MLNCKDGVVGCSCADRRPIRDPLSPSHAAGWSRFQQALCNMARDPEKYSLRPYWMRARYYAVSPTLEHRDAVHILGYGSEEELKYCMAQWRRWHPELFEEVQSA